MGGPLFPLPLIGAMAADTGAALLAAAVKAAILAGAPRRTVQAVAAAVTGVLVRPVMAAAEPVTRAAAVRQETTSVDADLVETLRLRRRARRHRKKAERREAKGLHPTVAGVVDDGTKQETFGGVVASVGGGQPVPSEACGLAPHEHVVEAGVGAGGEGSMRPLALEPGVISTLAPAAEQGEEPPREEPPHCGKGMRRKQRGVGCDSAASPPQPVIGVGMDVDAPRSQRGGGCVSDEGDIDLDDLDRYLTDSRPPSPLGRCA